MKKRYWLFMFFLIIWTISCKKDSTSCDLPLLTLEGKNTLGCRINGQCWLPQGHSDFGTGIYTPATRGGYFQWSKYPGTHILIRADKNHESIEMFIRDYSGQGFIKAGKYFFNNKTSSMYYSNYWEETHSYGTFGGMTITDSLHTGWIEILKSDTINKIISGRFEFEVYNTNNNKTYKITDGRFDYKSN